MPHHSKLAWFKGTCVPSPYNLGSHQNKDEGTSSHHRRTKKPHPQAFEATRELGDLELLRGSEFSSTGPR